MPEIRTFHPRRGRMSPAQLDALTRLLPLHTVPDGPIDTVTLFDGRPVVVEIGFGLGHATVEMAQAHPDVGIIGIEVHTPGAARLLLEIERLALDNVLVVVDDAVEFLRDRVPSASLTAIRAFFPDPWPKARHHKRRLVRPDLVALMASRLRPGAELHVATDWAPYAESMLAVLDAEPLLVNVSGEAARERPQTKFEQTGIEKGHEVSDLVFRRRP